MYNVLEIRKRTAKLGIGNYEVADLLIDGRLLRDWVRSIELPFAFSESHAELLAGHYESLPLEIIAPPSRHLFGESFEPVCGDDEGRISLLDCPCGCLGCWPLLVRITVSEDEIKWSDFVQPHRGKDSHNYWQYDGMVPFVFERAQYESAWLKISK